MIDRSSYYLPSSFMETIHSLPESQASLSALPFKKKDIAGAVENILNPKKYMVKIGDTIESVETALWVVGLGQSLLLGVKQLVGKTIVFDGKNIYLQSGTSFPVRPMDAANDKLFKQAA